MKAIIILAMGLTALGLVSELDAACVAMHMGTSYLSGGGAC